MKKLTVETGSVREDVEKWWWMLLESTSSSSFPSHPGSLAGAGWLMSSNSARVQSPINSASSEYKIRCFFVSGVSLDAAGVPLLVAFSFSV